MSTSYSIPEKKTRLSIIIRRRSAKADREYATCPEETTFKLKRRRAELFTVIHINRPLATGGSAGEYTDMDWSELCPDNDGSTFPRPDFWPDV